MDSMRAASILKNLRTLHIRMKKHSENAKYLSEKFFKDGICVIYPGLKNHPQNQLMLQQMNQEFGFGGMLVIDMKTKEKANLLMEEMQPKSWLFSSKFRILQNTLFSSKSLNIIRDT